MLTLNDLNKKKYITSKKNKKNKITMYDMGFGDAHILECDEFNSKEKLLVDCGSKNPKKCNVDKSLDLISKSLQGCHVSFLLTHFHNDHYNQLKKLKKLKNVYFDRIFVANIYSHIPTVYMTIYELLIYKKNSYYWNLAFDSLKEIPNLFSMLKENGILCFVSENSNFNLNNDVYKILSPQKGDEEFEPYKFYNHKILNFVESCVQRILKINNYFESASGREYELNQKRGDFKNYNDETESIISNKTFKFIKEELKNEIDDLYRDFNNTNFNLDDNTKAELKKIINKNKHKYNIVFGLMDNKNNTKFRLLMCGDEEKKDLKSIIDKNKIKEIGVMKVSHHGTPAYSSDYGLDKVESALIPYSYPNNKFGNWTIDDLTYSKHPYTEYCNPNVTKYY